MMELAERISTLQEVVRLKGLQLYEEGALDFLRNAHNPNKALPEGIEPTWMEDSSKSPAWNKFDNWTNSHGKD